VKPQRCRAPCPSQLKAGSSVNEISNTDATLAAVGGHSGTLAHASIAAPGESMLGVIPRQTEVAL
jgi:hypothetical protein